MEVIMASIFSTFIIVFTVSAIIKAAIIGLKRNEVSHRSFIFEQRGR